MSRVQSVSCLAVLMLVSASPAGHCYRPHAYYVSGPCGWYTVRPVYVPLTPAAQEKLPPAKLDPAPVIDTAKLTAKDAPDLFWRGYRAYYRGDVHVALEHFKAATKLADDDARYWYYLALSERAFGNEEAAEKAVRRAVQLQAEAKPSPDDVALTLERVQGEPRAWLSKAARKR